MLVFGAQPLSQPISVMGIYGAIGFGYRAQPEVIAPSHHQRVEFPYLFGRFLLQGFPASPFNPSG